MNHQSLVIGYRFKVNYAWNSETLASVLKKLYKKIKEQIILKVLGAN